MSLVTITQTTFSPPDEFTGTSPHARGFYSADFLAGDGVTPVLHGNGQTGFYYDIECSLVNGSLVVPAFTIQATTESNPTARFTLQLYNQNLSPSVILMGGSSGWAIPTTSGSTITYGELANYNRASQLLYAPQTYWTADQTTLAIRQYAGNFDYAGVGVNGITSLSYAPLVASVPIAVSTTDPNYAPNIAGGVYNVFRYGIVGASHSGTPSDESTAFLALLAIVYAAGGGTIVFNARKYRFDSSLLIPNDGATPPTQPSMRWVGQGALFSGEGSAPSGGTIIDLRYNSTLSKIDTRGLGYFEIAGITFTDGGAGSSVPFLQTTNTTLHIHDCAFYGNTANTPTQDALVLGGTATGSATGNFNSPFQGYGTVIENNYFNRIQRGVYGRTYCNNVQILNNTWWTQCGATSGAAAIEFLADVTNSDTGNFIRGNLIEMDHYVYGMKFGGPFSLNNIGPNGFFDPNVGTLAYYRFETAATYNFVIDGYRDDASGTLISETGGSVGTTTVLTMHQSQHSKWSQPWDFLNEVKSIRDNAGTYLIQNTAGDKVQQTLATAGTRWSFGQIPNGGSLRPQFTVEAVSATRVDFELDGSADNRITTVGASDLRVQAAAGQTLWLGTTAAQSVLLLTAAAITPSVPIVNASLTAPTATTIAIGSGTVISKVLKGTVTIDPASINATTFSSQTFTLTGAATGDSLILNPPAAGLTAGLFVLQCFVSSANTITICFYNSTGAPIDQASASWNYTLIR